LSKSRPLTRRVIGFSTFFAQHVKLQNWRIVLLVISGLPFALLSQLAIGGAMKANGMSPSIPKFTIRSLA
jgi:hypothetical protein